MRMDKKKVIIYSSLVILLIISFILRLWPLQISHWWDETVYLQDAEVIFSGVNNYNEFNLRPPMLSLLFAVGYIFKHSIFTASIIVSLLGTIGVLFAFLIGKELYNRDIGFLSALFFGLSPFMVTASHWIMTGIPALSFILISFYISILAIKKNNDWLFLLSGIIFGVSILTRFTSLVLFFIIPLYLLLNKVPKSKVLIFGYGLSGALLPYLIWAQIKFGFFLLPFIKANMAVSDTNNGIFYYLKNFLTIYPPIILVGLIFYIMYQLFLIKFSILKKPHEMLVQFRIKLTNNFSRDDLVFGLWIILFLIYISITPHKEVRYIIPIALPLYIFSARGFYALLENKNSLIKNTVVLFFIVLSIVSFSGAFSRLNGPFLNTQETVPVKVSNYIKSLGESNKVIYSNQDYPVYAYYTGMRVVKIEQQDKTFYSAFPSNMPKDGFFIYYKNIPKEPNYEWLESNKHFKRLKEIDNVIVYEYTP